MCEKNRSAASAFLSRHSSGKATDLTGVCFTMSADFSLWWNCAVFLFWEVMVSENTLYFCSFISPSPHQQEIIAINKNTQKNHTFLICTHNTFSSVWNVTEARMPLKEPQIIIAKCRPSQCRSGWSLWSRNQLLLSDHRHCSLLKTGKVIVTKWAESKFDSFSYTLIKNPLCVFPTKLLLKTNMQL